MGRVKANKPHRRTWQKRVDARENRSSAGYVTRIMAEVEAEKAKTREADNNK